MDSLNQQKSSTGSTDESQFTEEDVAAFLAAPLSTENQVGLIPAGEATSNIQQRDLAANVDDPFINQLLNYPPLFQGLAISNDHTSSQVVERERTETVRGIPNRRSTVVSPLQIDPTINSFEEWNSRFPQPVLPNRWEQILNQVANPVQISMSEQPMGLVHQTPPANAKLVGIQRGKAVVPESSSESVPPNVFVNIGHHKYVSPSMISSIGLPNMIPMENESENLQIEKELRREEPNEGSWNLRLIEGRGGEPWNGRLIKIGEGSSSKRQKPNSPPNTGLELRPPNSSPENQGAQNQNNKPLTLEDLRSKSLYDPGYEALGLAPDPHIRMFLAQQAPSQKGYHKFK